MGKFVDLEGLSYNNGKMKQWVDNWTLNYFAKKEYVDSVVNSDVNLLNNTRNRTSSAHCVIGPAVAGQSEAIWTSEETIINGLPVRYMYRGTFDYVDEWDTIKIDIDSKQLKKDKTYTFWVQIWSENINVSFDLMVAKSNNTSITDCIHGQAVPGIEVPANNHVNISYTFTPNENGTGEESIFLITKTGAFAWTKLGMSPFMLSESHSIMPWSDSPNDINDSITDVWERSPGRGYPIETVNTETVRMKPNVYTKHTGTPSVLKVYVTGIDDYSNDNNMKEYFIEFTTSSSGCTLTVPSSIKWMNGEVPSLLANTTYQLSIINECAVIARFA